MGAGRALAIAAATLAIQNGIVMAFAVLYLPLVAEFGATRAEVAAIQSAVLLLGGLGAPVVGWAFDRVGPRRLFQGAAILAAAGFAAAAGAPSLSLLVLAYGGVGGLGLAMLGSQANMIVAALWFPRARGRAIALVDLGTGFGAFCFIPLAQAVVSRVGWRAVPLAWAALLLAVVVPLNAFQRLPPGAGAPRGEQASNAKPVRRAVASPPFRWLAAMRFFGACAFTLMNTHLVAYAIGQAIAPETAASALGTISLVSLAGRLTTGWLADRIGRALALTLTYTSAAAAITGLAALAISGWAGWLAVYVALYGMAQGSSGIVASARAADVFAGPSFGAIYGWLSLTIGPGEALGAWLGGWLFDATGSYLPAFGFVVAALAAGLVCIWRVGREPAVGST